MRAVLDAGEVRLSGIIGPGHVTTVIGPEAWQFLFQEYSVPCAVAGFEPPDILRVISSRGSVPPQNPVGPCMVSAEGACAAYSQYGRQVPG